MRKADFEIMQGTTAPIFDDFLIQGNGQPVDLSQPDTTVFLVMATPGAAAPKVDAEAFPVGSGADGHAGYQWVPGDTDTPRRYYGYWRVTYPDGSTQSFPPKRSIVIDVLEA
jgi:hypothetical protein